MLQPGCLLPEPALLARGQTRQTVVLVKVDAAGGVTEAKVFGGTGVAEVDEALAQAVTRCRFTPAYDWDYATRTRTDVASGRELTLQWSAQPAAGGPHRCAMPDYPNAARRTEEAGTVVVQFRKLGTTGEVQAQLAPQGPRLRHLGPLSLQAVQACLQHEAVRAELAPDRWVSVAFEWRLE
jgi:TonB family protein